MRASFAANLILLDLITTTMLEDVEWSHGAGNMGNMEIWTLCTPELKCEGVS
jgi:hypothetical protein